MHSLGECFGHIWHAIKTPVPGPGTSTRPPAQPKQPAPHVRQTTREAHVQTPEGPVRVRRTVIDEVEPPKRG